MGVQSTRFQSDFFGQKPLSFARSPSFAGHPLSIHSQDTPHQSNNPEHIPYNLIEYIQLVEWTGRQVKAGKRGYIASEIPAIFQRLKINTAAWLHNCEGLEKTYYRVIGSAARLQDFCEKFKQQRVLGITAARQAFG